MKNYDLKQNGAEVQELLDQVPVNKKEIERLKQLYAGLSKTNVEIVASLPSVGVANTIYRVTGSDGYADYMFDADDLSTAVLLATYGNGIDDEPVAGSENLVKSGGVAAKLSELGRKVSNVFSGSKPTGDAANIAYPLKAGVDYIFVNTGVYAYRVLGRNGDTNTETLIDNINPNETKTFVPTLDAEYIRLGSNDGASSFDIVPSSSIFLSIKEHINQGDSNLSALITNLRAYVDNVDQALLAEIQGNAASITSQAKDIKNVAAKTDKIVKSVIDVISVGAEAQGIAEYIYSNVILGFDVKMPYDSVLESLEMICFKPKEGSEYTFYIGTLDQRNWLLPRITLVKNSHVVNSNKITFDFSQDGIIIKENEVIFMKTVTGEYPALGNELYEYPLLSGANLNAKFEEKYPANSLDYFNVKVSKVTSVFSYKEEVDLLTDKVKALEESLSVSNVILDRKNGKKYKVQSINGVMSLREYKYDKIAMIGNSFLGGLPGTTNALTRGMLATRQETDYRRRVIEGIENCYVRMLGSSAVDWERDYRVGYDLSTLLYDDPIHGADCFDAVIVQLQENSPYREDIKESWEYLYDCISAKYPSADLFQIIGWNRGNVSNAIKEACKNKNVVCIDCSLESMTGNSREGDYMIAIGKAFDSGEFEIMPKNYINHPSDVGFALIGNRILSALGYKELDVLHNLNIRNTEGGVVSAPFGKWAEKGIVSLKCEADEGMQISNVAVTTISGTNIAATKRTNSFGIYYTFVMPEEDVNIVPSWM